jgi:phosphatidylserine/phosphatidylglycerophosphate/cardiolipin synthase-like enzyme
MRLVAGEGHYEAVIERVLRARCSVWVATANIKDLMVKGRPRFRSILEELDRMAERGLDLRILHAALPSRSFRESFDRLPRLVAGGLELRQCPRVHLKVVVVDGELLYLGSANWTGAGLGVKRADRRNFELGLVTGDPLLLDQVQAHFDDIWSGRECRGCGRRESCEAPLST